MADAPASDAPEGAPVTAGTPIEVTASWEESEGKGGKEAVLADLTSERKARREAEKQAKAATAELQKLQEANMNEVDRALSAAKAEGRTEALREAGTRMVDAEVRAAAAGRNVDTDALLEGLDRTKFLGDDGDPNRDAITAFVNRIAPSPQERGDGFKTPDLAQGVRGNDIPLGSNSLEESLRAKLGIPR